MLARCARCQQTFTTDRYGVQKCPHCGGNVLLRDPAAPPEAPAEAGPGAPAEPPRDLAPLPAPPPGAEAPAGEPPEEGAPFARRREVGFLRGYAETLRRVAFEPGSFFRSVRVGQSGSAVLFGVLSITVGSWISTAYGALASAGGLSVVRWVGVRLPQGKGFDSRAFEGLIERAGPVGIAIQLLAAPVVAVVVVYLVAAVVHLFLLLFRGAGRGFPATLTVVGYAQGLSLLSVLPLCGGLVAAVWALVVTIVGLGEAQRCGPGRAAAATLVPVALLVCCACAAGLLGAATLAGFRQGQ